MKQWATLGMIGLSLLLPGCQLAWDITSNIAFETCLFTDQVTSSVYYFHLAGDAWKQYRAAHPAAANSNDFARGFKMGYTQYLQDGGIPGTPPVPPQRYWKTCYQSPEGRAATMAWFAGYKEGSVAAKASGYRNLVVIPAGKCDKPPSEPGGLIPNGAVLPGEPLNGEGVPSLNAPTPLPPGAPPAEPDLPAPRPTPVPVVPPGNTPPAKGAVRPALPPAMGQPGSITRTSHVEPTMGYVSFP